MTCYRTFEFCTTDRTPEIEALLEQAVPEIAAEIVALGIPELAGICLGGGYGRGEGGVFRDAAGRPHLYNDLDFFIFTSGASRKRRREIDGRIEEVSVRWTEKLGVDVDFGPAKNAEALDREARTLMFQELKHGRWQVWGEGDVLAALPALGAAELPPFEGIRLLLNRGMGLLLAADRQPENAEDIDFILRNLNKAVLGAADARLLGGRCYRYRAEERLAVFGILAAERGIAEGRVRQYARALEFKAHPDARVPEDWGAAWNTVRGFWCESVAGFAGCSVEHSPDEVVAALHRLPDSSGAGKVMNFLNWVRKTRSAGPLRDWADPPVLRMLCRLYRRLAIAGPSRREAVPEEEKAALCGMWKLIN